MMRPKEKWPPLECKLGRATIHSIEHIFFEDESDTDTRRLGVGFAQSKKVLRKDNTELGRYNNAQEIEMADKPFKVKIFGLEKKIEIFHKIKGK
jgi:hypothetical protein